MNAARNQRFEVFLHGKILPHARVHRRGNHHRRTRCHHSGRKHVIRNAISHLADDIRRCRDNQEQIRPLGQRNVLNFPRRRTLKRIHCNRMSGERFKRKRRDKLTGVLRHHHIHINALFLQQTKDFTCLIYSNAPGHAEDNAWFFCFT